MLWLLWLTLVLLGVLVVVAAVSIRSDIRRMVREVDAVTPPQPRVEVIDLQAGDLVVLTHPRLLSVAALKAIKLGWENAKKQLADGAGPVALVLEEGMTAGVVLRGVREAEMDVANASTNTHCVLCLQPVSTDDLRAAVHKRCAFGREVSTAVGPIADAVAGGL